MPSTLLLLAALAQADPSPSARVAAALALPPDESIEVDGVLDEAVWARATSIGEFVQQEPREGAAPSERTEVRIVYDRDHLYIGAVLHDGDPDGILAHQRARDAGLGTDDRFMWILDTFRDGRTGYFFEINPAGLMGDGLIQGNGDVNKAWDGIWSVRTRRDPRGWTAEIRIPVRTLNFDPASESWGVNFQRTIRRRNEEMLWSGHRRNEGLFSPVHAGRLTGLRGLSQGLGLEVTPYALLGAREVDVVGGEGWETPSDAGLDVSYSITPGLRASVSLNTDFAEAEVDQRQVNLTRFPLRFPEQRDFFLEGSGVFSFSPSNGVDPYFSRRIGLVSGQPVPVRFGARLAGQAGAYDLGFLQVRTGAGDATPGEDFTVARVVRNLFAQSSLGLVYTRRAARGAVDDGAGDHTLGSDLQLSTTRFLGDRNLRFQAFYVWHDRTAGDPGSSAADRSARGVRLTYPNDLWSGHVSYRELGERFDPVVGFTPRRGFRRVQPTLSYNPRPEWLPGVRRLSFSAEGEYLTDMRGSLQTRRFGIGALEVDFESGDEVSLDWESLFERIEEGFLLHPDTAVGGIVPAGDHRFGGWQLSGRTAGRRRVSGELTLARGAFWSGDRTSYSGEITVRPAPGVSVFTEAERNDIRLPTGEFTAEVLRAGGGWHASTRASLTGSAQYDNLSEGIGLFARFRWIVAPGSDLFLVYTHDWTEAVDGWITRQRGATSKLTYTHRF